MSTSASTESTPVIMKKNKEKFYVFDKEGKEHEYTITKKERKDQSIKYMMKRSKGEQWTEHSKGEKLFTLIDNDGDIQIKGHDSSMSDMAYHNMIELMVLLNFINKQSYMPSKYKFVEVD